MWKPYSEFHFVISYTWLSFHTHKYMYVLRSFNIYVCPPFLTNTVLPSKVGISVLLIHLSLPSAVQMSVLHSSPIFCPSIPSGIFVLTTSHIHCPSSFTILTKVFLYPVFKCCSPAPLLHLLQLLLLRTHHPDCTLVMGNGNWSW